MGSTENDFSEDGTNQPNELKFNTSVFARMLKGLAVVILVLFLIYVFIFGGEGQQSGPSGKVIVAEKNVIDRNNPAVFSNVDPMALKDMISSEEVSVESSENVVEKVVLPAAVVLSITEIEHDLASKKEAKDDEADGHNIVSKKVYSPFGTVRVSTRYMAQLEQAINETLSVDKLYARASTTNKMFSYNPYKKPALVDDVIIENQNDGVYNNLLPHTIPYLKVIPAMLILGHNSDAGTEMIAEVLTGKYKGARVFGQIGVSKYVEKGFIQFRTMVYRDVLYRISAIAVDANTNIPAIDGKVKKHWRHNIIYGFGVGFLEAFSAIRSIQGSISPITSIVPGLGPVDSYSVDTDAILQSSASSAVSKTISSLGQYRPPTYTRDAYTGIGLVFLPISNTVNNNNDSNVVNNEKTGNK